MATPSTTPCNDTADAPVPTAASGSAGYRGRLPQFSHKERIVLIAAILVVVGGIGAAALGTNRSTASAAPGATPVASAAAPACAATASAEATAPGVQPAAATSTSATGVAAVVVNTASAAGTTVKRSAQTATTKKATTSTKKASSSARTPAVPAAPSLVSVGTLVTFGKYGGAPLRWRVLDVDASGVLLVSEYILSAGAFQSDWEGRDASSYGASEVRTWLRGEFATKAFDTTQTASLLPHSGGAAGSDRVFLLSASEVQRYLPKIASRRAAPGSGAGAGRPGFSGQALSLSGPYAGWWLADPGSDGFSAQVVGVDGKLSNQLVYYGDIGVRPAIRFNRDRLNFSLDAPGGN